MNITLLKSCAEDLDVVNAARVSYATQHDAMQEGDEGLIRWLMKNRHGSPFEHTYFKFHVEAPIFVFREWHRHRAGHSYNEMSGRYVELEDKFYNPSRVRVQEGKPGAYSYREIADPTLLSVMDLAFESAWSHYDDLLARGMAKEQARTVLPVGVYSQMIWSCNARSLMHFLSLRNSPDAMQEIRELANVAQLEFQRIMPVTAGAFIDNGSIAP